MTALAWSLFGLGVAHIAFGLVRFAGPLRDACRDGFVGAFAAPEERRTAFWFLAAGPSLMVLGLLAVHASAAHDEWSIRVIGVELLVTGVIGVMAFPRSPLWLPLLLSPAFLLIGV